MAIANVVTMGYSTGVAGYPDNVRLIPTLGYRSNFGASAKRYRDRLTSYSVDPFPAPVRPRTPWQVRKVEMQKIAEAVREQTEREKKLRKGRTTKVDKELSAAIEEADLLIDGAGERIEDMGELVARQESALLAYDQVMEAVEARAERAGELIQGVSSMLERAEEVKRAEAEWQRIQDQIRAEKERVEAIIRADTEAVTVIMMIV